MPEPQVQEWQCPPIERGPNYVKSWCDELTQNGDRWVKSQQGIRMVNEDIRLLIGLDQDNQLPSNTLQSNIRTFVETITDLRQIATLGSKAKQFEKNVQVYNGALKFIFWDSGFVFSARKAEQYAMLGRGYMWTKFSRDRYGWGKGRFNFQAMGPFEFLPEQLPQSNDVRGCYAGTIITAMPIAEAHSRFQKFQEWLPPIARYDWAKYGTNGALRLDFWDRHRFRQTQDWDNRYCEIRYHFIRDLRINETGRTLQMGVDGSTWGYQVPSMGDLLVSRNPLNGLPESRKADESDCRVYPQLRLIITSPSCPVPLYDDTAFDWHGEIPVTQYDVNDWAWSPMGYSAIRNVAGLEKARRAGLSDINEVLSVRKDPPTGYDLTSGVPRTQMEKLDLLRGQGIRIGLKGKPEDAIKSVLPKEIDVTENDWKQQEFLDGAIKGTLGLSDISSLRELKMNVSDQSFEKIVGNLGPMAKGIALNQWKAHSDIAHDLKYSIPQYISVEELQYMIGPDGVALETYDNDPNSLVPGKLPGEEDGDSKYSRRDRAKWFAQRLSMITTPAQLLDITQMQEKMLYMFLFQKQAPLPMATYMEKFGIQDYDNQKQAWKDEQLEDAKWKLQTQKTVAEEAERLGLQPAEPQGGPGQGKGGGRPSTGQKPPKAELKGSKSGNVRAVNSTSG